MWMWALLLKCHFRLVLKVPTNPTTHCSRGRPNFQLPSRPSVQSMLFLLEAFDPSDESFETLGLVSSQLTSLLKSHCPFKMITGCTLNHSTAAAFPPSCL